jgi:hypothetical protein
MRVTFDTNVWNRMVFPEKVAQQTKPFPEFNCIVTALKSRTKLHSKVQMKVIPGF